MIREQARINRLLMLGMVVLGATLCGVLVLLYSLSVRIQ
jgi:hypothetical protein